MRGPVTWLVAALATAALGASGCGQVGRNIVKREVVVHFDEAASPAQHVAARSACSGLPHTTPEPMPTGKLRLAQRITDVRFLVNDANDRELLALYNCLQKQPGVVGVDIPSVQ